MPVFDDGYIENDVQKLPVIPITVDIFVTQMVILVVSLVL